MRVPLLDLRGQYAAQRDAIGEAIDGVLDSQHFIMGPEVAAFESEMAEFLGDDVHAIGCASGSDALLLAMMALDIGPGDEVIVPVYSFFATASCVTRVGAMPVWVDVEPDTGNIDTDDVARKLSPRTKAIIPVHLFGRSANLAGLPDGPVIIEDAAQSLGATFAGVQSAAWAQLGCLSFFPSKNLGGFGDGGMVTCKDPAMARRLDGLRRHGAPVKYAHDEVGLNSRLDALQAAILRVRLRAVAGWIEARRANAQQYRALFADAQIAEHVALPPEDDGPYWHTYNQFNLRARDRDALRSHLAARDIGTAIYYPSPLHLQKCFAHLGAKPGDCPVAEAMCQDALAIPVFPGMTVDQQEYVVDAIRSFYLAQ